MVVLKYEDFQKFEVFENENKNTQDDPNNHLREEVKKKISYCVTKIIINYPFFGEYLLKCRFLYGHPAVDTMATDGVNIFINEKFADSLTTKQCTAVLVHEVLHCVLMHHLRSKNLIGAHMSATQAEKWNYAADYEINPMIIDEGIISKEEFINEMKCLYEDKYVGMAAEPIYKDLKTPDDDKPNTPPLDPKVGDSIKIKSDGSFGRITAINADGSFEVEEITKEEAYKSARKK